MCNSFFVPTSRREHLDWLKSRRGKLLIVGQQPQSNDKNDPLSPDNPMWSGYRLMQMAGLTAQEYRDVFERININYEAEKTFRTSSLQKARAVEIYKTLHPEDTLIILGSGVLKCFRGLVGDLEPCELYCTRYGPRGAEKQGHSVIMIPHPSGLNRWYNDPSNTARAAACLRALATAPRDMNLLEEALK